LVDVCVPEEQFFDSKTLANCFAENVRHGSRDFWGQEDAGRHHKTIPVCQENIS
jgi:hypothetical protein